MKGQPLILQPYLEKVPAELVDFGVSIAVLSCGFLGMVTAGAKFNNSPGSYSRKKPLGDTVGIFDGPAVGFVAANQRCRRHVVIYHEGRWAA
jgi:hypothetical protein